MTNINLNKLFAISLLTLSCSIAHADYRIHINTEQSNGGPLPIGSISFVDKSSGGENGNGPTQPTEPSVPTEPTEPTEPTKTVAESCNEVVTSIRSFMVANGKTSVVGLSSTQNAESIGGCPVNIAVTFTDYPTYTALKNFITSTISHGNSMNVFSKNNTSLKPVEMLGLKFINKGNPSHLVYWTGTSFAQESSFSVQFK